MSESTAIIICLIYAIANILEIFNPIQVTNVSILLGPITLTMQKSTCC